MPALKYPEHDINFDIVSVAYGSASNAFNANAFPDRAKPIADDCCIRAALLLSSITVLKSVVINDRERFIQVLNKQLAAPVDPKRLTFLACYKELDIFAALHGSLTEFKSFLDTYAQLIASLVVPGQRVMFSAARIGKNDLSGGALINLLRRSAPKVSSASAAEIASTIEKHSREWITEAVSYRDSVSHNGTLKKMLLMHVMLDGNPLRFDPQAIVLPVMPNGIPLQEYFTSVQENTQAFVRDTMPLLPNVESRFLSLDKFLT